MGKISIRILYLLLFLLVLLPAVLYVNKFGFGIWSRHEDWAYMGSFFGGVLGPIVTLVSVLILVIQLKVQREQLNNEFKLRRCDELEGDIQMLTPKLSDFMRNDELCNEMERLILACKEKHENGSAQLSQSIATDFVSIHSKLFHTWIHMDACFRKLHDVDVARYKRAKLFLLVELDLKKLAILDAVCCYFTNEFNANSLFLESEH